MRVNLSNFHTALVFEVVFTEKFVKSSFATFPWIWFHGKFVKSSSTTLIEVVFTEKFVKSSFATLFEVVFTEKSWNQVL